jgi:hypothetical protein
MLPLLPVSHELIPGQPAHSVQPNHITLSSLYNICGSMQYLYELYIVGRPSVSSMDDGLLTKHVCTVQWRPNVKGSIGHLVRGDGIPDRVLTLPQYLLSEATSHTAAPKRVIHAFLAFHALHHPMTCHNINKLRLLQQMQSNND